MSGESKDEKIKKILKSKKKQLSQIAKHFKKLFSTINLDEIIEEVLKKNGISNELVKVRAKERLLYIVESFRHNNILDTITKSIKLELKDEDNISEIIQKKLLEFEKYEKEKLIQELVSAIENVISEFFYFSTLGKKIEDYKKEVQELQGKLEKERKISKELREAYISLKEDYSNLKKRTEKEIKEIKERASVELIKKIIEVVDDFKNAFSCVKDYSVIEGFRIIYEKLYNILKNEGLEPIDAKGKEFDPNFHEAIAKEKTEDLPENIVVEVIRDGYLFKGKLIRPALVKVSEKSEESKA